MITHPKVYGYKDTDITVWKQEGNVRIIRFTATWLYQVEKIESARFIPVICTSHVSYAVDYYNYIRGII